MKRLTLITAALMIGLSPAISADVKTNWKKNCAACHGNDGKGNTKAGRKAEVKDLTDKAYQAEFTDEKMFAQIRDGMTDKDGKIKMKPYKDKMTDEEMKALVAFVREFIK